jgi:hypothetical protein
MWKSFALEEHGARSEFAAPKAGHGNARLGKHESHEAGFTNMSRGPEVGQRVGCGSVVNSAIGNLELPMARTARLLGFFQ